MDGEEQGSRSGGVVVVGANRAYIEKVEECSFDGIPFYWLFIYVFSYFLSFLLGYFWIPLLSFEVNLVNPRKYILISILIKL